MKPNKHQIKRYFELLTKLDEVHFAGVQYLEARMKLDCQNDKIEFVWVDGNIVGIGSSDKKMKLIHRP